MIGQRPGRLNAEDPFSRENDLDRRVVREGHVITAKGWAFVDFTFEIFDYLGIYEGKQEGKKQLYKDIMNL